MKNLTLEHIARAVGGTLTGFVKEPQREITAVTTDSRKVEPGALFIPIVGARADGHDFIPQVMAQGAACPLSEKDLGEQDFPYIRVDSSLQAVKDLAEYYLEQLDLPVVGITGMTSGRMKWRVWDLRERDAGSTWERKAFPCRFPFRDAIWFPMPWQGPPWVFLLA